MVNTFCPFSFRISQKLKNIKDLSDFIIGPVDLVIDTPFYMGCYQEMTDVSEKATLIDSANVLTITWCLTECLKFDMKSRFAGKKIYLTDKIRITVLP